MKDIGYLLSKSSYVNKDKNIVYVVECLCGTKDKVTNFVQKASVAKIFLPTDTIPTAKFMDELELTLDVVGYVDKQTNERKTFVKYIDIVATNR